MSRKNADERSSVGVQPLQMSLGKVFSFLLLAEGQEPWLY